MLELADRILPVLERGEPVAVVTVSRVARSAPRGPGAAMAVLRDGTVIGSISGGCVEGDAVLLATGVLVRGGVVTASLGFSDDAAHAAGLACGGSVDVVIHRIEPDDRTARAALEEVSAGRAAAVAVVVDGADAGRILPSDERTTGLRVSTDRMLIVAHRPAPRLVIVGAGEHAVALARVASAAGHDVVVCDAWERHATSERFPTASRVIVGDPAALLADLVDDVDTTAVCVLTHDERLDVPAIAAALRLGIPFVGAMGARSTVAHRRRLLADAGVDEADVERLRSPLGLDLGGRTPDETAISVLAEIVAARHAGTGAPLHATTGPLHRPAADTEACTLEGSTR